MRPLHIATTEPVKSAIPNPRRDGSLAVYDGSVLCGFIVADDGSHFAFDQSGTLLGEFATRRLAMRSIPTPRKRETR
jgi:hypothetical protein